MILRKDTKNCWRKVEEDPLLEENKEVKKQKVGSVELSGLSDYAAEVVYDSS